MTETFVRIAGPHFSAGITIRDDRVVEASPPLSYLLGWTPDEVRCLSHKKGWGLSIVRPSVEPSAGR